MAYRACWRLAAILASKIPPCILSETLFWAGENDYCTSECLSNLHSTKYKHNCPGNNPIEWKLDQIQRHWCHAGRKIKENRLCLKIAVWPTRSWVSLIDICIRRTRYIDRPITRILLYITFYLCLRGRYVSGQMSEGWPPMQSELLD